MSQTLSTNFLFSNVVQFGLSRKNETQLIMTGLEIVDNNKPQCWYGMTTALCYVDLVEVVQQCNRCEEYQVQQQLAAMISCAVLYTQKLPAVPGDTLDYPGQHM